MRLNRNTVLFLLAVALVGAAGGIYESTSNNYYSQTFALGAEQRGILELPREFPGFMVALMSGALFFVAEANVGAIAAGLVGIGLFGLAVFANRADQYANMVILIVVWSAGAHLMIPVTQSLSLDLAEQENEGEKLGKFGSVRAAGTIVGCVAVWLCFSVTGSRFDVTFIMAAVITALAAGCFVLLARWMPATHHHPRPKLVLKRRYMLYYVLSVLFGARKQVFITFGPWVLITVFHQRAETIAKLQIVSTLLTILLLAQIGRLIDRFGERVVLMADAIMMTLVCLSYGFAQDMFAPTGAFLLVCAAYVADQFLFGVQMARATYLSKIAESRKDISGTLSLSTSIDHAVSIPIAIMGGWLWQAAGSHRPVFLAAAGVAVLTLIASSLIRIARVHHPELVEPPEAAAEDVRREIV
jgi:MFS family permease